MKIRILIDGRTIRKKPAGVGYTVIELLKILQNDPSLKVYAFVRKGINNFDGLSKIELIETPFNYQFVGVKRFIQEQTILPYLIKKIKPHILHLTDSFGSPLIKPKSLKIITTLHDLIPLSPYKELMSSTGFLFYQLSLKRTLQLSDKIACVSNFTKNELIRTFPQCQQKTITIYNGFSPLPKTKPAEEQAILKKFRLSGKKYFFYLGGFPPRKNVLNLIRAFDFFIKRNNTKFYLLLSGRLSSKHKDIQKNIKRIKTFIQEKRISKYVVLSDYLTDKEKVALIKHSFCFCYISLAEGFGLPVLEALSQGTPVITSKDSPMEEITQKIYAIYTNPKSIKEIADSFKDLTENYKYHKNIAKKAQKELISYFSWKKTAESYRRIYYELTNKK